MSELSVKTPYPRQISCVGAFPARTSQWRDFRRDWRVIAPDFSLSSCESLTSWHPASLSWRTSQMSLLSGFQPFSERFPAAGIMLDGAVYPHERWEPHTAENGGSAWLGRQSWPTPTANDAKNNTLPPAARTRYSLPGMLLRQGERGRINPAFVEGLMGFPPGWTELTDGQLARAKRGTQQNPPQPLSCNPTSLKSNGRESEALETPSSHSART